MKYSQHGKLNRRDLSKWFDNKSGRSDKECFELEAFIGNVLCGCGWDFKERFDFLKFNAEFGISYVSWRMWFSESEPESDKWPVVELHDSRPMWTWFQHSMQIGEWTVLNETCKITKKLIPFKNGFFKAEPIA